MLIQTPHYKTFITRTIKLAMTCMVLTTGAGLLSRELTHTVADDLSHLPPGTRWGFLYPFALLHGHVFLTGVALPLALSGSLVLARMAGGTLVSSSTLHWGWTSLSFGVISSLLLLLAKSQMLLNSIHSCANHPPADCDPYALSVSNWVSPLRPILYATAHGSLAVGSSIIAVAIGQSL